MVHSLDIGGSDHFQAREKSRRRVPAVFQVASLEMQAQGKLDVLLDGTTFIFSDENVKPLSALAAVLGEAFSLSHSLSLAVPPSLSLSGR